LEDPFYANFAQDISMPEQDRRFTQALRTCRDRLVEADVDLGAYNSAASAADVDDLRRALGYSEWNLYGSSYGTRLALTVMRDFPQGVRSVILDSVYPPQADLFSSIVVDMQRALSLLFERCAADTECNQDYPDLERVFYEVVDQVDEQPVALSVYRPKNLEEYPVVINGDRLIRSFFDLLYFTDDLPKLPRLIYEIHGGDWEAFGRMIRWSLFTFDNLSEGMFNSVECFEEAPFGSPQAVQVANAAANPRLSQAMNNAAAYQDCAAWDVPPAAALENQPVVSDIPTLILSGEHDPITPPAWGELTAEGLNKSQHLVFPATGHVVLGNHRCSNQVVEEFLAAPDEPVESSCMGEMPVLFGGN
jgi:pimeloyl-ACP methyl ester carboxylesterase